MILVTGATGTVGRETVRRLLESGARVRALVRNPGKAEDLRALGAEIARGDLSDPPTLDPALNGIERAFLCTTYDPRQVELQGNFVEAAERTGIGHLVKVSSSGTRPDSLVTVSRWHAETERRIRTGSLPWTFLRPNFFMQNLLGQTDTIRREGVFYSPAADSRAAFVDARDVASVAARALTGEGHEGKSYEITGPESLSHADLAATMTRVLGRPIRSVNVPPDGFREVLLQQGSPEWFADGLLELFAMMRAGEAAATTRDVEEMTGSAPILFERFVRDHASAFGTA